MAEWDGKERRGYAELREVVREEIEPLRKNQETIQAKISEWESGARWFRVFIIGTVGLVTMAVSAYEWLKDHIK